LAGAFIAGCIRLLGQKNGRTAASRRVVAAKLAEALGNDALCCEITSFGERASDCIGTSGALSLEDFNLLMA